MIEHMHAELLGLRYSLSPKKTEEVLVIISNHWENATLVAVNKGTPL
jgi:hypothetical protein